MNVIFKEIYQYFMSSSVKNGYLVINSDIKFSNRETIEISISDLRIICADNEKPDALMVERLKQYELLLEYVL